MLGEWKKKGSYGIWKILGKLVKNFMDSFRRFVLVRKVKMVKSDCRRKCLNIFRMCCWVLVVYEVKFSSFGYYKSKEFLYYIKYLVRKMKEMFINLFLLY